MDRLSSLNKLIQIPLVIILVFPSYSCRTKDLVKDNTLYEMKSFTLDQTSDKGEKLFNLKSPKAFIDNVDKIINTNKTDITLFELDQPTYKIDADKSKIKMKGDHIILNGNVVMKKLKQQKIRVTADQVDWYSETSFIKFSGNVTGEFKNSTIKSKEANYYLDKQELHFEDLTDFFVIDQERKRKYFKVEAKKALWDGNSGIFEFLNNGESINSKVLIKN
ncbi:MULTISPECIES: LPS export ABC transporter periplasmic protein LptC [Prochlorococcus]|uniref:LPS export ABC transporter periplasmic protein LptC n=1 Tax=Prochlorococcus TaxID=1218 RepID=UPI000533BAEE|nr:MULTISPECIES: LPS export ABC transporter periplasmic protein LptC [Prochlorococcus]KGG12427.1 putative SMC domain N terminal domain [Prochlorococcus sp. MIT 0601]